MSIVTCLYYMLMAVWLIGWVRYQGIPRARRAIARRHAQRSLEADAMSAWVDEKCDPLQARRWKDADNLEMPLAEVLHRAMQREDGVDPDALDRDIARAQAEEEQKRRDEERRHAAEAQAALRAFAGLQPNVQAAFEAAGVTEYRNGQGMVVYRRTAQPAIMQRSAVQRAAAEGRPCLNVCAAAGVHCVELLDQSDDDEMTAIYALGVEQPIRIYRCSFGL